MEFQKIANFLDINFDNEDLPKYVTTKWIEVYDQSQGNYNDDKEIRIQTSMLRTDLCDFSDAYIVVKGDIISVTKKHLLLMILKHLIIQQLMQLLLILQMIMHLVKKDWLLKTIHLYQLYFKD